MKTDLTLIGWREWLSLPELGIKAIKAKIDTGAKTSALHAFSVETFKENGQDKVKFMLHPLQRNISKIIVCTATILDTRIVSDSGGHKEERFVIQTPVQLGTRIWPIEITLTNRDTMKFRMLLGRSALNHHYHIDPAKSYLVGKRKNYL